MMAVLLATLSVLYFCALNEQGATYRSCARCVRWGRGADDDARGRRADAADGGRLRVGLIALPQHRLGGLRLACEYLVWMILLQTVLRTVVYIRAYSATLPPTAAAPPTPRRPT